MASTWSRKKAAAATKLKKRRLLLIICGILTVLALSCVWVYNWFGGLLLTQQQAAFWQGDSETRFAQLSIYFPVDEKCTLDTIYGFRSSIPSRLLEVSLESSEDAHYWCDAYSTSAKLTVTGPDDSVQADALAVGGDFFQFHPLYLLDGGYFSDEDLMQDLVVLDEELAWKLFGSNAVTGKTVTINDLPFVIAGVVARETDFASEKAYQENAGIFLSYSALTAMQEAEPGISTYELILADPVTGFAKGVLTGTFDEQKNVIVENSSRFKPETVLKLLGSFGERSMNTKGVVFPYWENAARLVEDYMTLTLMLFLLFAVFPFTCALIFVTVTIIVYWRKFKEFLPEWWEQRREAKWNSAENIEREQKKYERQNRRRGKHSASK